MSAEDVVAELREAREAIQAGCYGLAVVAIEKAERAWAVETALWAEALRDAEADNVR